MLKLEELLVNTVVESVQQDMPFRCMLLGSIIHDSYKLSIFQTYKHKYMYILNGLFFLDFSELDMMIESKVIKLASNSFQCTDCDFSSKLKSTVANHVESKHIQHGGATCNVCGKVCATRQACRMHKSRDHNPKKMMCNY